jgi:hypothetical protein
MISYRLNRIPTIGNTMKERLKEQERIENYAKVTSILLNNPHNPCNTFCPYNTSYNDTI